MSSAAKVATKTSDKPVESASAQGWREMVESFIVALVLAFMFKAFVAEVFVIPTGSMAPTLMGAHKDVSCPECGFGYQSGASLEYDEKTGMLTDAVVVGTLCPLCRAQNNLDLRNKPNDWTFNGDRIVVGKFNYLAADPERWDVIVFKFPQDARVNFIKRLIGKPNEELLIQHGDVYLKPLGSGTETPFKIARKPADKVETLLQPVFDSKFVPKDLIRAGWPSSMLPWPANSNTWKVTLDENNFLAEADAQATQEPVWLRYFHRFADPQEWRALRSGSKPDFKMQVDPYTSTLITDFCCYNAMLHTDRHEVYRDGGTKLLNSYRGGVYPEEFLPRGTGLGLGGSDIESEDGNHWVSDLACELDLELEMSAQGKLLFDLVESGVHYRCEIDTSSGTAQWKVLQGTNEINAWETASATGSNSEKIATPVATTALRNQGSYRVKFANIDNQLFLWVNGSLIQFQNTTAFDPSRYLTAQEQRPHWSESDPLDASPIGFAVVNGKAKVRRAQVWRDVYYIALPQNRPYPYTDYPWDRFSLLPTVTDPAMRREFDEELRRGTSRETEVLKGVLRWVYSTPQSWDKTRLFDLRRIRNFKLEENQFFPMGDNSAASADARSWTRHYVSRELLIGKALVLLWPHPWNRPVPLLPNVRRMGLIR